MTLGLTILVIALVGPLYALALARLGWRRGAKQQSPATDQFHAICLVPCLNEGAVVTNTVARLLAQDPNLRVVVVDDASDDNSAALLSALEGSRVLVLRRELPDARQGKGAALNHAFREIVIAAKAMGIDRDRAVIGVIDADGRLDDGALDAVLPWFEDPDVGGVQLAVRIANRRQSLLARMQDVEFAAYGQVFQRGRTELTSAGLGGNGQFARLSALEALGDDPWSDSLTEDLDLGIRLRVAGWRSVFEGSVAVHQQGLHRVGALLRQRTRWFQGHMQAWSLIPKLWRSDVPLRPKVDMTAHLILPVALLSASVAIVASLVRMVRVGIADPDQLVAALTAGPIVPWWYLLGFLATPLIAVAYWRTEPEIGFWRGVAYAHLYSLFTWVWFFAGWRALWRQFRGSQGWVKTPRHVDADGPSVTSVLVADPMTDHAESEAAAA